MNIQAFEKLWKQSAGKIPHLNAAQYDILRVAASRLAAPQAKFWGLVANKIKFRTIMVVHCYNFGNTSVKYPWNAIAANFGQEIPLNITQAGTIKKRQNFSTILDCLVAPFLTFGFDPDTTAGERLDAGFLLTEPGTAHQILTFDVIFPCGNPEFSQSPESSAILFYYLMKRLPCTVQKQEAFVFPGEVSGHPRYRVTLRDPMVIEPGWILLMLEKDTWSWGVVCG